MGQEAGRDHVTVSIVGTGNREGGGDAPTPSGTIAETPAGQPNLRINVVTPLVALGVRFVKAFLTSFLGAFAVDQLGIVGLDGMQAQAFIALGAAGMDLGKNVLTIFGRLEGRYPLWTGSI